MRRIIIWFWILFIFACWNGLAHADSITLFSGNGDNGGTDPYTLFSASGTNSLSTMDSAVINNTYPTPSLEAYIGSEGTGIYQIPGSKVINSIPHSYYYGVSGYYERTFILPSLFTTATLELDAVGDDEGYAYLNRQFLGYFGWKNDGAYSLGTSDLNFFSTGENKLTFVVSNSGGGPTGLSYKATVSYEPVPQPTTVLLLGSGLFGLAGLRRKLLKISLLPSA